MEGDFEQERQELGLNTDFEETRKMRVKSPDRMSYDAEVDIIRQQIGDLEDIRFRLGLSARKMTQLLLVDPSAWTRWTKKITPPPPHIFRALQWYLLLQEKNPAFTPQVFLASHWFSTQKLKQEGKPQIIDDLERVKSELEELKGHFSQKKGGEKDGKDGDGVRKTTREIDSKHQNREDLTIESADLARRKKLTYFLLGLIIGFALARWL